MPSHSNKQLPGSRRGSFRELFLSLGIGLLGVTGFFYWKSAELPIVIYVIPGGMGAVCLLLGILLPGPPPLTTEEKKARVVQQEEEVLKTGPANHQRRRQARGGTLNLTNNRLVFFSHGLNIGNADVVIPLNEITAVEPACTLYIIPNAIRVILADGAEQKFTVFGRKAWIDAIRKACSGETK